MHAVFQQHPAGYILESAHLMSTDDKQVVDTAKMLCGVQTDRDLSPIDQSLMHLCSLKTYPIPIICGGLKTVCLLLGNLARRLGCGDAL